MGAILMFFCQVKCIQCLHESNRFEPMMDLLVDIRSNVKSLEDALAEFTDTELLDGANSKSVTSMCFSWRQVVRQSIYFFQSCLILVCNVGKYSWIQDCTKLVKVDCKWLIQMV